MIRRLVPGALTFLLLGLVIGGAFAGLLRAAGTVEYGAFLQSPYTRRVVTFTVWQALLSTLLSVGPAILVARALARRASFPGRALLLRLFGLPLVLPTLVGILGVVAIYGQSGLFNRFLAALGLERGSSSTAFPAY
jgi:thiamine transport system permease protein